MYINYQLVEKNKQNDINDIKFWNQITKDLGFKENYAKYIKSYYEKLINPYSVIKSGIILNKNSPAKTLENETFVHKRKKTTKSYENIICLICQ